MNKNIFKLIISFLSFNPIFRRSLVFSLPLIFFASLMPTFFRWYLAKAVVSTHDDGFIYATSFLILFAFLALAIRISSWVSVEIKGSSSTVSLMEKIYTKISNLKVYNVTDKGISDFIGRLSVDAKSIREDFVISLGDTLNAVAELIISTIVIISTDTSLVFWIIPIFFVFFKIQNQYGTTLSNKRHEMSQTFTSILEKTEEVSNGFSSIKYFDKTTSFEKSLNDKIHAYLGSSTQIAEVTARGETLLATCSEAFGIVTYSYVVYRLNKGDISLEWAGVIIGTIYSFLSVLQQFSFSITGLSGSSSSLGRLLSLFDLVEEKRDGASINASYFQENIVFKNCNLSYSPESEIVLKDVNLEFVGKKHTLLIGKTGSGKSTIVNAIFQLIDVRSGQISLGNRDIKSFQLESFREKVSILPQEPILINGTIRSNIDRLGKISDEEYFKIIEKFSLESIQNLIIKKNGSELSPGQKQLVSLARIYTEDSPVVILDEPSSKLDDLAEKIIWDCVSSSFKHKTVIIISHKLEHLDFIDYVYKIEDGKIYECSKV